MTTDRSKCHYCDRKIRGTRVWRVVTQAGEETLDYWHCSKKCRTATFNAIKESQFAPEKRASLREIAQRASGGDTRAALDFIQELIG